MWKPNVVKEMIVGNDPDNTYFVMGGGVGGGPDLDDQRTVEVPLPLQFVFH